MVIFVDANKPAHLSCQKKSFFIRKKFRSWNNHLPLIHYRKNFAISFEALFTILIYFRMYAK